MHWKCSQVCIWLWFPNNLHRLILRFTLCIVIFIEFKKVRMEFFNQKRCGRCLPASLKNRRMIKTRFSGFFSFLSGSNIDFNKKYNESCVVSMFFESRHLTRSDYALLYIKGQWYVQVWISYIFSQCKILEDFLML